MSRRQIVKGLTGSSASFYIAQKIKEGTLAPPLLIATPTLKDAENIYEELKLFSPESFNFLIYPPWESKPFDLLTPTLSTISERINVLWQLQSKSPIVIAPINALIQWVIPKEILERELTELSVGKIIDLNLLKNQLLSLGYRLQDRVFEKGDFAVRGNIIDVFSANMGSPVRIELFGDEIEFLRFFHPETQRSENNIDDIIILPNREIILKDEYIESAQKEIKERSDSIGIQKISRDHWVSQLKNSIYPREVDSWLPFFYSSLSRPIDYLSSSGTLILIDEKKIQEEGEKFEALCREGYEIGIKDLRLLPQKEKLYIRLREWNQGVEDASVLQIESLKREDITEGVSINTLPIIGIKPVTHTLREDPLKPFLSHIRIWKDNGNQIIIVNHTKEQLGRLKELLELHRFELRILDSPVLENLNKLSGKENIIYGSLGFISKGFEYPDLHLIFIAEEEVFGVHRKRRAKISKESPGAAFFTSLEELREGDLVVHVEHGIGEYGGLHQIKHGTIKKEFLLLSFKGGDRLYLPVHRVNLLQKYIGHDKGRAPLDQLGGQAWDKRRKKVNKAVEELAHELLKLYAKRELAKGFSYSIPDNYFLEFESEFEFEETEDQQQAIDDVINDMCNQRPMDRLVCGDVGYGKTEVAMRAAFKAVMDHKQVAILCPTTILASQHERTFKERFSKFPITIESLSRFKSTAEKKAVANKLLKGEVDIVIGTHALLSKDIKFKDLGLAIIDEEQRFGVKHKERLKSLRTEIDVLTLTATPIPRTLSFTLSGLRDLSTINTPPIDRHAIQTYVTPFHEEIIRNAILEELKRGGQVFFVHNRVQTIDAVLKMLETLIPEAKYGVAHGQLPERALEKVMGRFLSGEIDVLICSSIIESGLDIPTANTLIVNRADTFGLAQLYQLRGRVGRSKEQALAYFLIPSDQTITEEAQKRLEVIERYTEFGSGFRIASHDLEIRGGGDILGRDQSGHISAIGFELYTKLLNESIKSLKGEKVEATIEPEINIQIPALLPGSYIQETKERLTIYKRLAMASTEDDLGRIRMELKDRFGEIPVETENLILIMSIKIRLQKLKVKCITASSDQVILEFDSTTKVSHEKIIGLITKWPLKYQLRPANKLVLLEKNPSIDFIKVELDNLLQTIA